MQDERRDAIEAFLREAGWGDATIAALQGDASTRRYLRVERGGKPAILMDQPPGVETPPCPQNASAEERHALGYNAVARLAGPDCARFLAAGRYLRGRGLSAPEIYAADPQQGFILLEDLGDRLYGEALSAGADETELYGAAIDALAQLHREPAPTALAPDKPLYAYDETALMAEIELMTAWFLPLALGRAAREEEVLEHRRLWHDAIGLLKGAPEVFVHRDYHSPNLLWLPERRDIARVGVIDFQDAVAGPRSYDIVSLLEDARRDVVPELAEALTRRYFERMRTQGTPVDAEHHRAEMAVMAAQRNTKIIGIFARLFKRDAKPRYLAHLPRMWGYLSRDLEHPALAPLKAWYDRSVPADQRGTPSMEGISA